MILLEVGAAESGFLAPVEQFSFRFPHGGWIGKKITLNREDCQSQSDLGLAAKVDLYTIDKQQY